MTWYIAVCRHCGWVIYSNDREKLLEMMRRHLIRKHRIFETNFFRLRSHFYMPETPEQLYKLLERCRRGEIEDERFCRAVETRLEEALKRQALLERIMAEKKARSQFIKTLRKSAKG